MVAAIFRVRTASCRIAEPYQPVGWLAAGLYYIRAGILLVVTDLSIEGAVTGLRRILLLSLRCHRLLCLADCRNNVLVHWSKPGS